jgi:hypothetical protein
MLGGPCLSRRQLTQYEPTVLQGMPNEGSLTPGCEREKKPAPKQAHPKGVTRVCGF